MSGDIPSSFGKLVNLISIELGGNQLTGNIQPIFNKLTKMIYLDIAGNQFTGSISFLNNMHNVGYAALSFNKFSGKIPILNNIDSIGYLDLAYNQFSGKIPTFRKSAMLQYFNLSNNLLSGTINNQFDSLSNFYLDIIITNNQLTGNVPLHSLAHLHGIDLTNNQLNGTILSINDTIYYNHLQYINLSHNQLTGKLPVSINKLYSLNSLDVSSNYLSGTIPALNKTNLHYLSSLHLENNQFTFAGMEDIASNFPNATYAPQANINIQQNGNVLKVSAGGTLSNNTYKWYKNGVLFKTKTGNASLTVNGKGNYSVAVTNSIATALTLYSDTVNYAGLINSNASQLNSENNFLSLSVYPNPANKIVTLTFNATGKYVITVNDVSGKILQTKNGVASKEINPIQLDVSNYANGIYFVTIKDESNHQQTIKFNKE